MITSKLSQTIFFSKYQQWVMKETNLCNRFLIDWKAQTLYYIVRNNISQNFFAILAMCFNKNNCHYLFYNFFTSSAIIISFVFDEIGSWDDVLLLWHSRWNWFSVYSFYFKDDEVSVMCSFLFYYQVIYSRALGIFGDQQYKWNTIILTERSIVVSW